MNLEKSPLALGKEYTLADLNDKFIYAGKNIKKEHLFIQPLENDEILVHYISERNMIIYKDKIFNAEKSNYYFFIKKQKEKSEISKAINGITYSNLLKIINSDKENEKRKI